jgi:hypothetical protein
MGGDDSPENLVLLTAREHFVAHQLLVKMHPKTHDLVFAFRMLSTANYGRHSSRTHEWLRERMARVAADNMRERNKRNPEILKKARDNFTEASKEKQRESFARTMQDPSVRAKWSDAAKKRWETRDRKAIGETLKKSREGKENSRSRPVIQLFPNGFVVNEFPNMKAAALANGHDKHTIYDRVKRGHPLWVAV